MVAVREFGTRMSVIAAIALPIVLAVMGIIVSIKTPPKEGYWHWAWLAAFVVAGSVAIFAGVKDRMASDAGQQELKATINGLRDSIDKLTKPLGNETTPPKRDPDTLYQNGGPVGKVTGARITLNESKVYFDQIENAGNLDLSKVFEYRDYNLRFVRADSHIGMLVTNNGVATNVYQHVVCDIAGRTK
jgi:hypothetical protein